VNILGIDFTSAPSRAKPITVARCRLAGARLVLDRVDRLTDFAAFDEVLATPGPWVAGLDFPFGQTRRLVSDLGWPETWPALVRHVARLGTKGFAQAVKGYEAGRPAGAKQPRRAVDRMTGGQPPQKVQWQPVGLMFAQGAPRLLASGVHVAGVHQTGADRVAVEVYPGVSARALVGRSSYKAETGDEPARRAIRVRLVEALRAPTLARAYGVTVDLDDAAAEALAAEPKGDDLDALLCAVQAAWAARQPRYGVPADVDPLEGWISDPHTLEPAPA